MGGPFDPPLDVRGLKYKLDGRGTFPRGNITDFPCCYGAKLYNSADFSELQCVTMATAELISIFFTWFGSPCLYMTTTCYKIKLGELF